MEEEKEHDRERRMYQYQWHNVPDQTIHDVVKDEFDLTNSQDNHHHGPA
jgi:hypothetical protein